MTPRGLIGSVAAEVVLELMGKGETGIRLEEVTPFEWEPFLATLAEGGLDCRVVLAGVNSNEAKQLSKSTGFPNAHLTSDLEVGTQWRNDPKLTVPIVVVSFSEQEKLGTFHRFTPIRDHNLYRALCQKGSKSLAPNKVLQEWWRVLSQRDIGRQISVKSLAAYILYLEANQKRVANHENVFVLGPTGVGQSFVACALAQKACRDGYSALYTRAAALFRDLAMARADGSLRHLLARLSRIEVLVIDDWAMAPLSETERRDFWEICEDRYQTRSTILTSQLPVSRWHEQIGDATAADGILDRLVHNAHRIEMKGDSMRKKRGTAS